MSCTKAQGFLADSDIKPKTTDSPKAAKLAKADALKLAKAANKVIVAKGKKLTTFDMKKDAPTDAALLKAMLGPTGNLRAPAIRRGKTLLIGFNQELYEATLG